MALRGFADARRRPARGLVALVLVVLPRRQGIWLAMCGVYVVGSDPARWMRVAGECRKARGFVGCLAQVLAAP